MAHRFCRDKIQFDKSPGPRNTEYCENEELPVETKERGVEEWDRRGQWLNKFEDSKSRGRLVLVKTAEDRRHLKQTRH